MTSSLERYKEEKQEYAGTVVLVSDNGFPAIFEFLNSLELNEEFSSFEVILILRGIEDISQLAFQSLRAIRIFNVSTNERYGSIVEIVRSVATTDYFLFFEDAVVINPYSKVSLAEAHKKHDILGFLAYLRNTRCHVQCTPLSISKFKKYRFGFVASKFGKFCDVDGILKMHPVAFSIRRQALTARLKEIEDFRSLETVSAILVNNGDPEYPVLCYINTVSVDIISDITSYDLDQEWSFYFNRIEKNSNQSVLTNTEKSSERCLLFVDDDLPKQDQNEGSVYSMNLMRIFIDLGYHVHFYALHMNDAHTDYMQQLRGNGIRLLNDEENCLIRNLSFYGEKYTHIILSRVHTVHQYLGVCRSFAKNAKIIFNTIDLHYLRIAREAILKRNRKLLVNSKEVKKKEIDGIKYSDATIVISNAEHDLLVKDQRLKNIYVIPIIRDLKSANSINANDRKDLIFIGTYNHPPNYDAALFLINYIWPILKKRLPAESNLYLVGNIGNTDLKNYENSRIRVLGHVPNIDSLLEKSKVGLAPLRFGAGLKGKVITYMESGLPVVATSIALEGTRLRRGDHALVSDTAEAFAKDILMLYEDQTLWDRLSQAGIKEVRKRYSFERGKSRVVEMIERIDS